MIFNSSEIKVLMRLTQLLIPVFFPKGLSKTVRILLLQVRLSFQFFFSQSHILTGQVASLTSTNNFINFCLTVPNLPITNGQQVQSGSCNPAPIGAIPSIDNMPSAKFVFPKNTQSIPANQKFTLQLSIKNLGTGNFVNAQKNYFAAPQQLQGGTIKGHSHAVIEKLSAIDQTTPTNPKDFVFFKVCFVFSEICHVLNAPFRV